eukprot:11210455-Lingulodinium_polyedra.AAC.1
MHVQIELSNNSASLRAACAPGAAPHLPHRSSGGRAPLPRRRRVMAQWSAVGATTVGPPTATT